MTLAYQNPDMYDATQKAHRPMVPGSDAVNPAVVPVSARGNNALQVLSDGLYLGNLLQNSVYYVSPSGSDSAAGTKAAPWQTLDGAIANLVAMSPAGRFSTFTTIALQAGQAFYLSQDMFLYAGRLNLAFYGDPQYGDFNGALIGTSQANPAVMADLLRPTITPIISQVNAQWKIAAFVLAGGDVQFTGVQINLPAAPSSPSIGLYSSQSDFVRVQTQGAGGIDLSGAIVNVTDTNSYWGFLGMWARARPTSLCQFASQFRINNTLIQDTSATTAQLTARANFIKFYADFAGNNQQLGTLAPTSSNSSSGSALLNLMWSDTEALTVSTGKTNQATFPLLFPQSYGMRNYFTNLVRDQQQRPLNVVSPRLF